MASCFWRLDLGVSSVFTTIIFLPLSLFINRKKININSFLKGVGLFSCLILLTLLLSILFRSTEYLATIITTTLHYISASQAHGYSLMANNFNQQFFIFHLILPLGSLLFIMISIYYLRYKQHILSDFQKFSLYSSLFLFIVFLTNFQRGLVRHNFMENSDSFLASTVYIATALFLLTFIKHLTITYRYLTFLGLSFCIIIFIKYFPVNSNQSKLETFLTSSPLLSLPTIYNNQNIRDRVISNLEFEEETYNDFKQFLDVNLLPNQTFLDFSNTPMLYYYCNRAVPSFFCQNLQNTVDEFLQKEQLKKVNPLSTPIVVYSNYPPNWWDNTDGVPNSMRQILIAEYIYENYVPYGIINNRSIWYSKSVKVEWNVDETDTLISLPKTYDYKYAAATISNFAKNHKTEHYQKVGEDKILLTQSSEYVELKIEKKLSSTKGVYINLIYDSIENNKEIKVDIFNDTTLIGTTTFKQLSNNFTYMIPLSNHYLWHSPTPKSIRISKQDAVNLSGIEFYKHIP
ncbi:MAG: hypothetical protein H6587_04930 [Flavobacteriales bacterium]|nr:hypothetical protein [Flavobacteriales bacterium]